MQRSVPRKNKKSKPKSSYPALDNTSRQRPGVGISPLNSPKNKRKKSANTSPTTKKGDKGKNISAKNTPSHTLCKANSSASTIDTQDRELGNIPSIPKKNDEDNGYPVTPAASNNILSGQSSSSVSADVSDRFEAQLREIEDEISNMDDNTRISLARLHGEIPLSPFVDDYQREWGEEFNYDSQRRASNREINYMDSLPIQNTHRQYRDETVSSTAAVENQTEQSGNMMPNPQEEAMYYYQHIPDVPVEPHIPYEVTDAEYLQAARANDFGLQMEPSEPRNFPIQAFPPHHYPHHAAATPFINAQITSGYSEDQQETSASYNFDSQMDQQISTEVRHTQAEPRFYDRHFSSGFRNVQISMRNITVQQTSGPDGTEVKITEQVVRYTSQSEVGYYNPAQTTRMPAHRLTYEPPRGSYVRRRRVDVGMTAQTMIGNGSRMAERIYNDLMTPSQPSQISMENLPLQQVARATQWIDNVQSHQETSANGIHDGMVTNTMTGNGPTVAGPPYYCPPHAVEHSSTVQLCMTRTNRISYQSTSANDFGPQMDP